MAYRLHLFPGLTLLILCLAIQWQLTRWLVEGSPRFRGHKVKLLAANAALAAFLCAAYLLGFQRVMRLFPGSLVTWWDAAALLISATLAALFFAGLFWRRAPQASPGRRAFLKGAGAAVAAAPYVGATLGIIQRDRFRVHEVRVLAPNLPRDLDGLRFVQITDIHLSAFLSEKEFARAIDMANETRAHVALVTGDLISRPGDPVDACLRQLGRVRADAGVLGCLGNHEVYTRTEDYVTRVGRSIGIEFLRDEARTLRFGNAAVHFAGVDYQKFGADYLVDASRLVRPDAYNVLLSHNPDVFRVAASQGYDLTIAGHTHGGQVNFEILHQDMSVARYFTPYVKGLYREENAAVYVSTGIGTIGVPIRIGAPPEIAVIRLCAS